VTGAGVSSNGLLYLRDVAAHRTDTDLRELISEAASLPNSSDPYVQSVARTYFGLPRAGRRSRCPLFLPELATWHGVAYVVADRDCLAWVLAYPAQHLQSSPSSDLGQPKAHARRSVSMACREPRLPTSVERLKQPHIKQTRSEWHPLRAMHGSRLRSWPFSFASLHLAEARASNVPRTHSYLPA